MSLIEGSIGALLRDWDWEVVFLLFNLLELKWVCAASERAVGWKWCVSGLLLYTLLPTAIYAANNCALLLFACARSYPFVNRSCPMIGSLGARFQLPFSQSRLPFPPFPKFLMKSMACNQQREWSHFNPPARVLGTRFRLALFPLSSAHRNS